MNRLEELKSELLAAKKAGAKWFYITVRMEGFPKEEIIINPIENLETKLAYYTSTYDNNLKHKFAKEEVRITSFGKWMPNKEVK